MKRIICFIVIIAILCFQGVALSSREYNDEQLKIARSALTDMGLWEDFIEGNEYITRAEAAAYLCMIVDVYEDSKANPHGYTRTVVFEDLDEYHWAYDFIRMQWQLSGDWGDRIMQGDGNGVVRPDDNCTYGEFVKLIVSALGWYPIVLQNGGYPDGFFYVADRLGVYPLNEASKDSFITKEDAIILIYNAVKAPMFGRKVYGHVFGQIDPILSRYRGIHQTRGFAEKIDDNSISIDGKVYQGKVKAEKFSEGLVLCYYKYDKQEDISTIVTCYPISDLNFDNPRAVSDELPREWLEF